MKKKINEVIVVEGKNDAYKLRQVIDADILITDGLAVPKEILDTIAELAKTRGIIVFTDPDSPGNRIRHMVEEVAPNCKHLYIQAKQARWKHKVGVEHASNEDILEAFEHISEGAYEKESISWNEYLDLGLAGNPMSAQYRLKVAEAFHIGMANAKTFFRRLNMARITKEDIERRFQ